MSRGQTGAMQITHLGHSCVLIEVGGTRLLIDPGNVSQAWHQVTGVDAVLVTHKHTDHADPANLPGYLEANPDTQVYVEDSVRSAVRLPDRTRTLAAGDEFDIKGLHVQGVGGKHAIIHADLPRDANVGVVISAPGEPTVFHPGDALDTAPAGVDIVCIPAMGPWSATKETIDFVRAVGAPRGFLIHEGLLNPMGYGLISAQLSMLTSTQIVDVRDTRPWEVSVGQ